MNAVYLIPLLPLLGFAALVLMGKRLGDPLSGWLATAAIGSSFVASVVTFAALLATDVDGRSVTKSVFTWLDVGGLHVKASLLVDPLSMTMCLFVTGVGTLIHLYAVGYMHGDSRYPRFFVYLNLFAFSMLMLVLGDNLLITFLGWEGVGACSYLLISFWFERETAAVAGKKAFVTNRVGDFGFLIAIFLAFSTFGTLTYKGMFAQVDGAAHTTLVAMALLLFLGACGKSAQLPLYVWLPDAMEGPTPVSALIHAATMVTAGVYLMARMSPVLHEVQSVQHLIAWVGVLTALFAATIACAQDDIKKVLAYSTISQLGFMFLAVGTGAYVAAIFHMVTHAFFKALLFLGAGSVIHGLHDEQDMKRMGSLRKWMPITSVTFIIGWLAIAGFPGLAGFWSKDDILAAAWADNKALWAIGVFTAGLTAYYMTRQVALVFFGEERWRQAASTGTGDKEELTEPEPVAANGHGAHDGHAAEPHESPWTMTVPLGVLAFLSLVGGAINLPFGKAAFLERWLHPVVGQFAPELHVATGTKVAIGAVVSGLAIVAIVVGFRLWATRPDRARLEPEVLRRAWGVDALYSFLFGTGGGLLAAESAAVDRAVVDGAVNGAGSLVRLGGAQLRKAQSGYVRNYALGIAAGAVLLLGYAVARMGL
ncbi:MAG: NADH-quinone oxidoreductase subunit [Acidimicrobiaceae bacterium]|jgi:NADH-quinone oxidoreductase subunit L|nr:NADH-quinone oxidoreductase subunit [Acidimicrobiaceae bacterium]